MKNKTFTFEKFTWYSIRKWISRYQLKICKNKAKHRKSISKCSPPYLKHGNTYNSSKFFQIFTLILN